MAVTPEEFAVVRRALTTQLTVHLARMFVGLGSWRDPDSERFVGDAVPLVLAAQRTLAGATSVYVADTAAAAEGVDLPPLPDDAEPSEMLALAVARAAQFHSVAPPPIPDEEATNLRGIDPEIVYHRPFTNLYTDLARGEEFPDALDHATTRLEEIAELDMQQTYARSSRQAMRTVDRPPSGWRRVLNGEHNCALCIVAATQRYTIEDLNPIHPNCVPAGRVVQVPGALAGTRRWYSGELAVVTTASGDEVTVTPNHPVLTPGGWVAAGEIRPGDHLVSGGELQRIVGGRPNERDAPALVEDVWRALAVTSGFACMPLAAEDFHGDGANGEVDIVWADRDLAAVGNGQQAREGLFVPGRRARMQLPGAGAAGQLVPVGGASANGVMSGGGLVGALLGGHLCGPHETSLRTAAAFDSGLTEPAVDDTAGHAALVGDDVFGEPVHEVIASERFDRVTDVHRVEFTGHVHNFQTRSGWYVSDNHIVHNCDCGVEPLYGRQPHVLDPEMLVAVHAAVQELASSHEDTKNLKLDAGGRVIDYSKIIVEHGELGQMLARPMDRFTSVADIPSRYWEQKPERKRELQRRRRHGR